MMQIPSRSAVSRFTSRSRPYLTSIAALAIATGCAGSSATKKGPPSTVSDSDYGRLAAGQTRPVDEARAQLALAQDELGRAKLSVVNDQHMGELARSDQAVASAEASRAVAETKAGQESNEPAQMQQARESTQAAQTSQQVADARLAYSKKLATSQAAHVTALERKVELMTEKVNVAKLQALDNAAVAAAGKYDRAQAMQRVVDAQRAFDGATSAAAAAAAEATTAKEHWRRLDPSQP
jgi:hypothetical protein